MTPRPTPISGAKLALLAAKARAEGLDSNILASHPIAITGIGCRFPGGVSSAAEFWTLLRSGTDAIRTVPTERWDAEDYYSSDPHEAGRMNTRWGGFLDNTDHFDPIFFGLSPREAASMDPQQRLLLEITWEALWDGGYAPGKLAGSATGVFVTVSSSDYARLLLEDPSGIGPHTAVGSEQSIASGRISFLLDLRGPSIVLDTACSSSLIAVHLACQSLRSGECRLAIAGGVTLKLTPEHYLSLSKLGMLSPNGRCMTFDARANGFVPGEGCGIVTLKCLADALADGDRIYALIRGSACNQDGRTSVITAPSGLAQQAVVRAALANARISGADVTYVETHGTGTPLGDPIEVEALSAVLDAPGAAPCALGAVKSNIGHLEVTAGVAGLIKAALAMDREEVPPNLHFQSLNPHIVLEGTRLFVPTAPTPWKRDGAIRFAGVSSFGFSGTNGHLILEEAPVVPQHRCTKRGAHSDSILTLSARTPEALQAVAEQYREFLDSKAGKSFSIADICAAAASRRDHFEERLATTGASHDELRARLADALEGRVGAGSWRGRASVEAVRTAFLFSGQGSQWPAMGAGLLSGEPVFRSAIEECEALALPHASWSMMDVLRAEGADSRLDSTEYAQPAICALEIALARLLSSWGIVPVAVIGHSAGEIAAAHVAGALSLAEAMRLIVLRGRIMQAAAGNGAMVSVSLSPAEVMRDIECCKSPLSIAAINGPLSTVVSGDRDAIGTLTAAWRNRGVEFRLLPVDYAFHSAQMDPLLPLLEGAFGIVRSEPCAIPLISTVTGLEASGTELNASYWVRAVRQPVLFRQVVEAALARGIRCFVEIGPHPVLTRDAAESVAKVDSTIPVLPTLRRGRPERPALLATVAGLYVAGHAPRWESICGGRGPVVALPTYPYQRQRYWAKPKAGASPNGASRHTAATSFALAAIESPALRERVWETTVDLRSAPFLADHIIGNAVVFPLTGYIELAIAAARELEIPLPFALQDLIVREPLLLQADAPARLQLVFNAGSLNIHSKTPSGWSHHVLARLLGSNGPPVDPDVACDDLEWSPISVSDLYAGLRKRGSNFGPAFRCIRNLRGSGRFVEAEVSLASNSQPSNSQPGAFALHPALFDACLQTSMVGASNDSAADDSYMPIAIDSLSFFRPAGDAVRCQLALHLSTTPGAETRSADFVVTTPQGERVVSGRGLLLKRVNPPVELEKPEPCAFEFGWAPAAPEPSMAPRGTTALLIGDSADLAGELESALLSRGVQCVLRSGADINDAELSTYPSVVFAADLPLSGPTLDPMAVQESGCRALLEIAQRIIRQQPPAVREVWVVTHDAQRVLVEDSCAGFSHATIWGLARTLALEHPMTRWMRCDIDSAAASRTALAEAIASGMTQDEGAFRSGVKYVPRLIPVLDRATAGLSRLVVNERGSTANLRFETIAPKPLESHQVEVEVHASALNFRDVLNVLGAYPGDAGALGAEFCGRVVRVGSRISRFKAGDRVMGISWGALSDVVVAGQDLITHVPSSVSNEEAITLPNVFATVFHSLVEAAQLRAGERVLIHAAAGGIGTMAVQIAQHLGAEIFATAGSEDKRQFLRDAGVAHVFNSRSLSFAPQILEATGGAGVDVALNSLAGDFIGATFSVMATGGRFVEIGKTGIWPESKVAGLGKRVRYSIVDLAEFVDRSPQRIADLFRHMQEYLSTGAIRPLPRHEFRFEDAVAAFRFMERGRHTGKIVLRHRAGRSAAPSGTWLITGGLGALGLELAEWLVSRGVSSLLLLGRHSPDGEAQARLEELRRRGVQVETHAIDLARDDAFDKLDALVLRNASLRIAGIAHLAGVVDDGVVEQQSWARFRKVFEPKVKGAWPLHRFAVRHRVPQLILFSSISAVLGSPGQSSYAASNAFLDSLAGYRTGRGETTVTIDWGAWEGAGMAARLDAAGKRLGLDFVRSMPTSACLAAIPLVLENGALHAAVFLTQTSKGSSPGEARLRTLLPAAEPTVGAQQASTEPVRPKLVDQLAGLSRPRARKLVVEHLREETRLVLGLPASHLVDEWQPLMKLGLDSLMALEMRNRIAAAFGRPFSATLLFDRPTIGALADFLLPAEDLPQEEEGDEMLDALAALSDEKAERLLAQELDFGN